METILSKTPTPISDLLHLHLTPPLARPTRPLPLVPTKLPFPLRHIRRGRPHLRSWSTSTPPPSSFNGWEEVGLPNPPSVSHPIRHLLLSFGIANSRKNAFLFCLGFVCALSFSRLRFSTLALVPVSVLAFAAGLSARSLDDHTRAKDGGNTIPFNGIDLVELVRNFIRENLGPTRRPSKSRDQKSSALDKNVLENRDRGDNVGCESKTTSSGSDERGEPYGINNGTISFAAEMGDSSRKNTASWIGSSINTPTSLEESGENPSIDAENAPPRSSEERRANLDGLIDGKKRFENTVLQQKSSGDGSSREMWLSSESISGSGLRAETLVAVNNKSHSCSVDTGNEKKVDRKWNRVGGSDEGKWSASENGRLETSLRSYGMASSSSSSSSSVSSDSEFNQNIKEAESLLKEAKECLTNEDDEEAAEVMLCRSSELLSTAIALKPRSLLAVGQLGNTFLLHGELKLKISRDLRTLLARSDPLIARKGSRLRHKRLNKLSSGKEKLAMALVDVCEECEQLLVKAGKSYRMALSIDESDIRALYNWGLALTFRAQLIGDIGPEAAFDADKVYLAAIDKFSALASRSRTFAPDALFRWGLALQQRSQLRPPDSRGKIKLLKQAKSLFEDVLRSDADNSTVRAALFSCISELNFHRQLK